MDTNQLLCVFNFRKSNFDNIRVWKNSNGNTSFSDNRSNNIKIPI